jgi:CelD/BcsL family acetyltransferase involved in cellulose biosynthesis
LESDYSFGIIQHNDPEWMDFVSTQPEANIFHHPAWIDFIAKSYGYHPLVAVVQNKNSQIIAGLPIMEIVNLSGKKRWVSLPFTDHCSPLFCDEISKEILTDNIVKKAELNYKTSLELRWDYQSPGLFQTVEHVLTISKLDLQQNEISKSIQNFRNIKKAEQRGVCIQKGNSLELLEAFYKMHLETRRRHGVPIQPWHFFKLLKEQILDRGLGFISLAHKNGNYLSGVVYLHWNRTLTYKFAASTTEGREIFAGDLLIWDAICFGCENGYKVLDFGRTDLDDSGLRRYKKRWRSEEIPLSYSTSYRVEPNPIRQKLISMVKVFINKSPLWVCRLSGELLYRYFG